jgi:signal transduction histidine kinase
MQTKGAWTSKLAWGAIAAIALAWSVGPAPAAAPLGSIAEVLALSPAEIAAEPLAVVRGVVTWTHKGWFVVEDEDAAIYVAGSAAADDAGPSRKPELGDEVEIAGSVVAGGYAPLIGRGRARILGRRPVPPPVPADLGRLLRGLDIGRRVTVQGVVQGFLQQPWDRWGLSIDVEGRSLTLEFERASNDSPPVHLIAAEIRAVGLVDAFANSHGQFLAPALLAANLAAIEVVEPAPADPFAGEITPLDVIARYSAQPRSARRIRTEGVVSFASPELLLLQNAKAAVRVRLAPDPTGKVAEEPPFAPGDRVQVAGVLDMCRNIAGLAFAVARRVGVEQPPEPENLAVADVVGLAREFYSKNWMTDPGSHDGRLVRCTGLVEAVENGAAGLTATLSSDGSRWFATVPPSSASADATRFTVGSTVAVAGILQLDLDARRLAGEFVEVPRLERITVLARDASDVTVVRAAPWWTPRRLAAVLAAATAALAASVGGVVLLGRRVRQQAVALAETMRVQRESAVEFEAALRERSRLAANLHDTVLQTVTGIGYQLQVCQAEDARQGAEGTSRLDVAQRMVDHAVDQLRGTVWALHAPPDDDASLAAALEARLAVLRQGRETPIRCTVAGRERPVAPEVRANLLLVAQEAVVNALRHAAAGGIDVTLDYGSDDTVTVTVRDDGRGFRMSDRPGALHGHFGIEGMIDRMVAVAGECTITSRPGGGTTVVAVAPAAAADLSGRTGAESAGDGSIA